MPTYQRRRPRFINDIFDHPVSECLIDASEEEESTVKNIIGQNVLLSKVSRIKKVKNDFLEMMYSLKKAEIQVRHKNVNVSERLLIHVTGEKCVNSIIRNNFDWRRVRRSKFGRGTSFSADATYANIHANKFTCGDKRAFIITKVLIAKCEQGSENQLITRPAFDTTTGNGGKVYVKYQDNEMLPCFVAYYDLSSRDSFTVGSPIQGNIPSLVFTSKKYSSPDSEPTRYEVEPDIYSFTVSNSRPKYVASQSDVPVQVHSPNRKPISSVSQPAFSHQTNRVASQQRKGTIEARNPHITPTSSVSQPAFSNQANYVVRQPPKLPVQSRTKVRAPTPSVTQQSIRNLSLQRSTANNTNRILILEDYAGTNVYTEPQRSTNSSRNKQNKNRKQEGSTKESKPGCFASLCMAISELFCCCS